MKNKPKEAIAKGANFNKIAALPIRESIGRFKYIEEKDIDQSYDKLMEELRAGLAELVSMEVEADD
mgnify:FL=1